MKGLTIGYPNRNIGVNTSISLHETGQAHKDKVESFLRGVYRKGKEDKEQAENVRREIQRIELAAGVKILPASASSKPSTSRPSRSGGVSGSYGYGGNYYVPSIHELRNPQKEQVIEQGREEWAIGKEIAKVGSWQVVAPTEPPISTKIQKTEKPTGTTHDIAPEFQDDDDDDTEDLNTFKVKEKEYPTDNLQPETPQQSVIFKKRKLPDSEAFNSRKKKPLRKKD